MYDHLLYYNSQITYFVMDNLRRIYIGLEKLRGLHDVTVRAQLEIPGGGRRYMVAH